MKSVLMYWILRRKDPPIFCHHPVHTMVFAKKYWVIQAPSRMAAMLHYERIIFWFIRFLCIDKRCLAVSQYKVIKTFFSQTSLENLMLQLPLPFLVTTKMYMHVHWLKTTRTELWYLRCNKQQNTNARIAIILYIIKWNVIPPIVKTTSLKNAFLPNLIFRAALQTL